MNDYNNKKYYWIKLQTNFFSEETIDFLLSQNNGCKYVVLYQMLCLKTANNNGCLSTNMGEIIIPYDVEKITRDTKYFDIDIVRVALELFKKLGLIYEQEDKILKISNIENMVGSITQNAIYKQNKRLENVQLNSNKSKSIEYRDKNIDIDNIKKEIIKEKKSKYGEYKNVLLTDKELQSLKSDYDNSDILIKYLDEYIEMKGYKAKSHYLCIKKWVVKAVEEHRNDIPKWFNKNIKKEDITEEEQKQMEELLKEFK